MPLFQKDKQGTISIKETKQAETKIALAQRVVRMKERKKETTQKTVKIK